MFSSRLAAPAWAKPSSHLKWWTCRTRMDQPTRWSRGWPCLQIIFRKRSFWCRNKYSRRTACPTLFCIKSLHPTTPGIGTVLKPKNGFCFLTHHSICGTVLSKPSFRGCRCLSGKDEELLEASPARVASEIPHEKISLASTMFLDCFPP